MEKVSNLLKRAFIALIGIALLAVVVFETGIFVPGAFEADKTSEFTVLTIMELLTVAVIPLALYLFRIPSVKRALMESPEASMRKWGIVRMLMIGLAMVANTLSYYLYMNASFGYLAIICLIAMAFVYPSTQRCKQETTPEEPKEE